MKATAEIAAILFVAVCALLAVFTAQLWGPIVDEGSIADAERHYMALQQWRCEK